MMKEKLAALYALQQVDNGLDAIKRAAGALDPGKNEHAAYIEAKAAHTEADTNLRTTTTGIQDAELQQQSIQEKKKQVETKMNSGKVTNYKELQAMSDEVEMFQRQLATLDEKLLGLMEHLETHRQREKETKKVVQSATAAFKTVNEAYKKQVATMQEQHKVLLQQRKKTLKEVAPEMLKIYDPLRANKGGIAIVPVEDGNACGGCKMGLGSALIARTRDGRDISYCDNCMRILFIPEGK